MNTPPRHGEWIQTFTGKQFWPLDPTPAEVDIKDIAHSLSMQCRYAGHCNKFYSVAEHSVMLAIYLEDQGVPPSVALWGLLHDASEAYMIDLPRPVKASFPEYRAAERNVMRTIAAHFDLPGNDIPLLVKETDHRILSDELAQNMRRPPAPWSDMREPLGVTLNFWHPTNAERQFLNMFTRLEALRNDR